LEVFAFPVHALDVPDKSEYFADPAQVDAVPLKEV
jgi:hypothetical protein